MPVLYPEGDRRTPRRPRPGRSRRWRVSFAQGTREGGPRARVSRGPQSALCGREASARRLQFLRAEKLRAHVSQSISRAAAQEEPASGAAGRPADQVDARGLASVLFSGASLWPLIGVTPVLSRAYGIFRQLTPPKKRTLAPVRAFWPREEGHKKYGTLESVLSGAPPGAPIGVTTWQSETYAIFADPAPLKCRALQRPVFGFRPPAGGHKKNRALETVLCSGPLGAPDRRKPPTVSDLRENPGSSAAKIQGATAAFPSPSSPYYHVEQNRFAVSRH